MAQFMTHGTSNNKVHTAILCRCSDSNEYDFLEWKKDTYAHRHTQTHTELLQAVGFVIQKSWLFNVAWLGTLIIKAFRRYDSQCVFGECVCMCEKEGETLEAVSCIVSLSEGKPELSYQHCLHSLKPTFATYVHIYAYTRTCMHAHPPTHPHTQDLRWW